MIDETGIDTPSVVDKRANKLRESFAQLVESYPDDKELIDIARQFDTWHYEATKEKLPLEKMFGGTEELQKWERVYAEQYNRLKFQYPLVDTRAPIPTISIPVSSPYFWPIIGLSGLVALFAIYKMTSK